jgi:hypothetical protein
MLPLKPWFHQTNESFTGPEVVEPVLTRSLFRVVENCVDPLPTFGDDGWRAPFT